MDLELWLPEPPEDTLEYGDQKIWVTPSDWDTPKSFVLARFTRYGVGVALIPLHQICQIQLDYNQGLIILVSENGEFVIESLDQAISNERNLKLEEIYKKILKSLQEHGML